MRKLGYQERKLLKAIVQQKLDRDVVFCVNGDECHEAEEVVKAMEDGKSVLEISN